MKRKLTDRQLILSFLSVFDDCSRKEVGAAARRSQKGVSKALRRSEIKEEDFEQIRTAMNWPLAAVASARAFLQSLDSLSVPGELTPEELAEIEAWALRVAHQAREVAKEAVLRSRAVPVAGYPDAHEAETARWRAAILFARLEKRSERQRLATVQVAQDYQSWALCETVCEASVRELSRNLDRAAAWSRLALEIAERVPGPAWWRDRVRGFAKAFEANVIRVKGELPFADTLFEVAKRHWTSGADPDLVLDPGRLFSLEASLRTDQCRLPEALVLLGDAAEVSRSPERVLLQKGFTLEVMGEYERAVETLLQAEPLVARGDARLRYMLLFNLAVNCCHARRYHEASKLAGQVRALAMENGDELEITRVTWLVGRIAAGEGRHEEARQFLAQARREFAGRNMSYHVALALLEEAVVLLEEGRPLEAKILARELRKVFASKGVHLEALAALRLFQEAAEREEATVELARSVLRFLFRARYDQGLRFGS